MAVADAHVGQAGRSGGGLSLFGVTHRSARQVVDVEVGMEAQQSVRDVWIEGGDETGDLPYFLRVNVTWHQQSTGYDQGGIGTLRNVTGGVGQVQQA